MINLTQPTKTYSTSVLYQLQQKLIDLGYSEIDLVQKAATASLKLCREKFTNNLCMSVLCGKGNNAADGYALALQAAEQGYKVRVLAAEQPRSKACVHYANQCAKNKDISILTLLQTSCLDPKSILVDAVLGIGSHGALAAHLSKLFFDLREWMGPKLALDIPSGIDAVSADADESCIKYDATIEFLLPKSVLLTGTARAISGEKSSSQLALDQKLFTDFAQKISTQNSATSNDFNMPVVDAFDFDSLQVKLKARDANSYKSQNGKVLLIGGDDGYAGACVLAAESALYAGVGMLKLASREQTIAALVHRMPQTLSVLLHTRRDLTQYLSWPDVIVIGPGLGTAAWGEQMLDVVLRTAQDHKKSLVLDADALNLLSEKQGVDKHAYIDALQDVPSLLTPHTQEAARLLNLTAKQVAADRYGAACELASTYNSTVILKGAGSIVCSQDRACAVALDGGAELATAGSGDVLTGLCGALISMDKDLAIFDAAQLAVAVCNRAGRLLADKHGAPLASELAGINRTLLYKSK